MSVSMPVPVVAPFGWCVTDPEVIQDVWDTFVRPSQEAGEIQSSEMRVLMAILRAAYVGLTSIYDAREVTE